MGLLDDAIREHLELKRRRGADPGEVAQQERAALEPAFGENGPRQVAENGDGEDAGILGEGEAAAHGLEPAPASAQGAAEGAWPGEIDAERPAEAAGQETAELDMRAVLEEDLHEGPHGDPLASEALHGRQPSSEEEAFEWHPPAQPPSDQAPGEGPPEQIPGQERLSFE